MIPSLACKLLDGKDYSLLALPQFLAQDIVQKALNKYLLYGVY